MTPPNNSHPQIEEAQEFDSQEVSLEFDDPAHLAGPQPWDTRFDDPTENDGYESVWAA